MSMIQQLSPGPPEASTPATLQLPHVLLVVDGFPKSLGGGERIVLRLAAMLPAYGYRASILTFALHPEGAFQPSASPCPLYLLPLTKTYDRHALRGARAFGRLLREEDVAVVQTFFESSDLWAGLCTRLLSTAKLIWNRRDMGILRGRKHQLAYRWFRRLPHRVFAVSAEVRQHVIRVDGVSANRVITVHNGLDLGAPAPPNARTFNHQRPFILCIGNIRRVKGHDLLVKAAVRVIERFPGTVFAIAGEVLEPEFDAELKRSIAEFGVGDQFRFLGGVRDLQKELRRADLFVLPSRSEGFSNALIEAMAEGLPVIATAVGGNAEAVQDGAQGLLVPPEDETALAAALLRLLSSPEQARAMGEAAQARVYAEFTAKAMMHKIATQMDAVLQREPVPSHHFLGTKDR